MRSLLSQKRAGQLHDSSLLPSPSGVDSVPGSGLRLHYPHTIPVVAERNCGVLIRYLASLAHSLSRPGGGGGGDD